MRPPLRTCRCGARYAAWADNGCAACRREHGSELAVIAREQREARRQQALDRLAEPSRAPVYDELPEGF